jgi:hypothetical protein
MLVIVRKLRLKVHRPFGRLQILDQISECYDADQIVVLDHHEFASICFTYARHQILNGHIGTCRILAIKADKDVANLRAAPMFTVNARQEFRSIWPSGTPSSTTGTKVTPCAKTVLLT